MGCREECLAAFVNGDLTDEEERAVDLHLLECESCWQAVREDRFGRAAALRLRAQASPTLEDRVRLAVAVASRGPGARHDDRRKTARKRGLLVGAMAAVVAAAVSLAVPLGGRYDPAQVAAVKAMLAVGHPTQALLDGEQFVVGGQRMTVRAFVVEGTEVLAATSSEPFPEAHGARPYGSSDDAWIATSGAMALYGVNHSNDSQRSMFVVSIMPMRSLPDIADRLKLT